jgi:hypothetical protein
MTSTRKILFSLENLDRRLGVNWERAGLAKVPDTPACVVRLDGVEFIATGIAKKQILDIPGFRGGDDHFVKQKAPENFQPYRRVANFESDTSIWKMHVLYKPTAQWIAPFKVTLISQDKTGLLPVDVLSILELLPGAKLVRIDVAFDFGYRSGVDGAWVRSHSLFGKARRNQVGIRRGWDAWGSRKGTKFVRSYYKKELNIHRLELQLNRKFLRRFGIHDIFDFWRLISILPLNHILFAEIDTAGIQHHLRMRGFWGNQFWQILERVADASGDLLLQCAVLRKRGGFKNVRRVLIPLKENHLVAKALGEWAAQWPTRPKKLGVKQ